MDSRNEASREVGQFTLFMISVFDVATLGQVPRYAAVDIWIICVAARIVDQVPAQKGNPHVKLKRQLDKLRACLYSCNKQS